MQRVRISDVTGESDTWNPARSGSSTPFSYIDISSIDQSEKLVSDVQSVLPKDAPSRARQLVQAGDVLVSTVRPNLNAVAEIPKTLDGATASTGFAVLRPKTDRIDGRYLFHWVRTPAFVGAMVSRATGASYPAVTEGVIRESKLPLPPLAEQRRIAAILDKADAIRRKRRESIKLLEEFLRSAFLEMFGDPVRNPKGWTRCVLGDVIHAAKDGPHVSPEYSADGVPFLSTRHIRPNGVVWKDLKYITPEEAERQWKKCKPERGDILYTKGGTTGIATPVEFDVPIAVWVHVALLKTNHSIVHPVWLTSMLNNHYCYVQSQTYTHGTTNRDLGLTRMVKIKMYLPPLDDQMNYVRIVETQRQARRRVSHATDLDDALFNSLVQRAFRGEL